MRINVYSQELTDEVLWVTKVSNTGVEYHAVQFVLHSSQMLHHPPDDDDRSAVTFWLPNSERGLRQLQQALRKAEIMVRSRLSRTAVDMGIQMQKVEQNSPLDQGLAQPCSTSVIFDIRERVASEISRITGVFDVEQVHAGDRPGRDRGVGEARRRSRPAGAVQAERTSVGGFGRTQTVAGGT